MTIYRYNVKSMFRHGFNLAKLKREISDDLTIKKPLVNITNNIKHPYIILIEIRGMLNIREVNKLNDILKRHTYVNPNQQHTIIPTNNQTHKPTINHTINHTMRPRSGPCDATKNKNTRFINNNNSVSGIVTTLEDIVIDGANNMVNIDGYNGINIGNNTSNGPINIATTENTRNITVGNITTGTNIAIRYGGSLSFSQYNEFALPGDTEIYLDFGGILCSVIYGNPQENTTIVLPNAINIIYYDDDIQINDGFDFSLINLSATSSYTLITDESFTMIGSAVVEPSKSAFFRLKVSLIAENAETCTLFRIA